MNRHLFLPLLLLCAAVSLASGADPYLLTWSTTTQRNNHDYHVGMKITVNTTISVTELGRFCISGNSGTHNVKIVNAGSGGDVPNASVNVSMTGGVAGQFKYMTLPTPVTLTAGSYYVVSKEDNLGDYWYDRANVTTGSAATCDTGVYWNGSTWIQSGPANQPYFTANFKYTVGASSDYVLTWATTTQRNNHPYHIGMKITVNTTISVTELGRFCISGNSGTHNVKIVNAGTGADVPNAFVDVSMTGGTAGQFKYVTLPSPVPLTAGSYYVVSKEDNLGDYWYDRAAVTTGAIASCDTGVYWNGSTWVQSGPANQPYFTANFRYTAGSNSPPSVNITSPTNGTNYTAPAGITINASASDTDGTITQVEFFNGTNLLGTDSTYPYSLTWSNVAAGNYSLTAKATDNGGAVTTSSAVSVTVNGAAGAPFITSVSATNLHPGHNGFVGMQITVGASNITVTDLGRYFATGNSGTHTLKIVTAAGADVYSTSINMSGGVSGQFKYVGIPATTLLANGVYYIVSNESSGPGVDTFYDTSPVTTAPGAVCNGGIYHNGTNWASGGSVPYPTANFKFTGGSSNVPPTVNISSPTNGATFMEPVNITISGTASDTDGTITKVDLYSGSTLLGTDNTAPFFSFTWNNVPAGTYSFTAVATDNGGATTTSAAVNVTVNPSSGGPPTNYSGPIYIQPAAPTSGSLHVERVGSQSSAMDIYCSSTSDAIRFWATDSTTRMRSRFNSNGSYLTNGWMVLSGFYEGNLTNPNVLYPTGDNSMVEVWSNILGSAVTIRPNATNPTPPATNATLSTMDKDGKYRFSIYPDGSLNFAAANSNTFNSANFDTKLYRAGAGQLTASGNFTAASIKDTIKTVTLLNNSGATVSAGDVLILDPAQDGAFKRSTAQLDATVVGVARQSISAGGSGMVGVLGVQPVLVTGAVNRGDRIVTSTVAGAGRKVNAGETVPAGALIGKALTGTAAGGLITVVVNTGD